MQIYVNERAFNEIQNGTKIYEGRLGVKRFLDIKEGSKIEFCFKNDKIQCCFQRN